MNINLVKADVDLFAVYQTIYSNADTNMSYDWNCRLKDTKWATDQCYFLILDGKRIGGVIITDDSIRFPFLITPYCDRVQFWTYLLKLSPRKYLRGMLDEDVSILPMFDYKAMGTYMALCRPADVIEIRLSDEFICRPLVMGTDAAEFGKVYVESHTGGICFEKYGTETPNEAIAETMRVLGIYNSHNLSIVIVENATSQIVGACTAGIGENHALGYAEIADLIVLPQYRGRGLGKYMIGHIVTQTYGLAPFVKMGVDIGNSSEYLYRQMGFIAGPRFTRMERRTY